jgi:hypothetical protein
MYHGPAVPEIDKLSAAFMGGKDTLEAFEHCPDFFFFRVVRFLVHANDKVSEEK